MVAKTNPLNETQFKRLRGSIDWSERQFEYPRRKRRQAVKQFVGYHYSEGGASKRVPTPFLKMAVNIYVRLLAARAPRVLMTTKRPDLKWVAANMELALNEIPREIKLQNTLRRAVTEALFSPFGMVKYGLHTVGKVLGHDYGASFVDLVTLDDLFLDMAAHHMDEIQYIGNSYWLDYKEVMESEWFKKKKLHGLEPDEYTVQNPAGEERAESISVGESAELFKKKIWLRDVWLPAEKLVVTYGVKSERILKVVEWTGPEHGPYAWLGFDVVPGQLLPLPPVAAWRDLHELGNSLFRKLGDQADAAKSVLGFQGGDDEDVENFQKASDGDGIRYAGTPPIPLKAGGIDQPTLAFYLQCRDLFSYFGGNLDAAGGLSPQSETLGQDRLIREASSAQVRDMSDSVVDFAREIFQSLAYYEWHDPVRRRQLEKPIPGADFMLPVVWDRQSRVGKFDLYDLDIDVYSLQDDSPTIKLQKLGHVMQQYVLPLMPAIEQAGGILDVQAILDLVARYAPMPEMREVVKFSGEGGTPTSDKAAAKPQNTTRRYERVNRPGATESGKSQILQQALLGGQPQKSEAAAIGRSTS